MEKRQRGVKRFPTRISIAMTPELVRELIIVAAHGGVKYTNLARKFIEDGLKKTRK